MFIDKESHLPGQINKSKTVTIKMTRELLRHRSSGYDCPFFHALRYAGIDVYYVAPNYWTERADGDTFVSHRVDTRMRDAIKLIDETHNHGLSYWWRCLRLAGKEFEIKL